MVCPMAKLSVRIPDETRDRSRAAVRVIHELDRRYTMQLFVCDAIKHYLGVLGPIYGDTRGQFDPELGAEALTPGARPQSE